MVKWGEIAALMNGSTTGKGPRRINSASRGSYVTSRTRTTSGWTGATSAPILDIRWWKSTIDWTKTRLFVVHLSEGIDETFDELRVAAAVNAES